MVPNALSEPLEQASSFEADAICLGEQKTLDSMAVGSRAGYLVGTTHEFLRQEQSF